MMAAGAGVEHPSHNKAGALSPLMFAGLAPALAKPPALYQIWRKSGGGVEK